MEKYELTLGYPGSQFWRCPAPYVAICDRELRQWFHDVPRDGAITLVLSPKRIAHAYRVRQCGPPPKEGVLENQHLKVHGFRSPVAVIPALSQLIHQHKGRSGWTWLGIEVPA